MYSIDEKWVHVNDLLLFLFIQVVY